MLTAASHLSRSLGIEIWEVNGASLSVAGNVIVLLERPLKESCGGR